MNSGLVKSEDARMSAEKCSMFINEILRVVFLIREGEMDEAVRGI